MMNSMNGIPASLVAVVLCSLGCASFREVAPPPGTVANKLEVKRASARREFEIGGMRASNWVSAGERWAADIVLLLEELHEGRRVEGGVIGLATTINQSGLPTASFLPLHRQLVRAMRAAAERHGLALRIGVEPGASSALRLEGVVVPRVIGEVRPGDSFTLSYELRLPRER